MPHMKVHSSGGIVFVPTKEEKELNDLKHSLKAELEEVKELRQELLSMKEMMKDASTKG